MSNRPNVRSAPPIIGQIPEALFDLTDALTRIHDEGYNVDFGIYGAEFIRFTHRETGQRLFLSIRQDPLGKVRFVIQEQVPPEGDVRDV